MKNEKIAYIFLLCAILLIGLSGVAFAESENSGRGNDDSDDSSDDINNDTNDDSSDSSDEKESDDSGRDSPRDVRKMNIGTNDSDPRNVRIGRDIIKDRLDAIKENSEDARNAYRKARADWNATRTEALAEKRTGNLSLERIKEVLSKELDLLLNHVVAAQSAVANDALLSEERKAEILANLEEKENWLLSEKEKLDAATTKEELKEIQKEIREKWNELKKESKRTVAKIGLGRVNTIIETAHKASAKLHARLDAAKEQGAEVSGQESALAAFDAGIAAAQLKFEAAKSVLEAAHSSNDFDAEVRKGMALAKEAHELLKDAYSNLRIALQGFRQEERNSSDPAPPAVPEGG